jgi:hypothetical protein
VLGDISFADVGWTQNEVADCTGIGHEKMKPESEKEWLLRRRKLCLIGPDRHLCGLPARRLRGGDRGRVQGNPHCQQPESIHKESKHLSVDAYQGLAPPMVARASDQVWKQVKVVRPNGSVKTQLRIVGPTLLHDRKSNNLRVGYGHPTRSVAEPDSVGYGFGIEIVKNAM